MTTTTGAALIAQSLKQQGVDYMFGIVGFPVYGVAHAAQQAGIQYYGFRNEQAASYAAGAVGYLTGRPGACLAVSGPGMVHGIAGLANAEKNCWPMVLLGGANDRYQNGQGAFQECPQVEAARPFSKYSAEIDAAHRAPFYVEQAVRTSIYGRPGASYLNLTNDVLTAQVDEEDIEQPPRCPEPPTSLADPRDVERAVAVLREAKNPLVIVGKGAAYARAEQEVRRFVQRTNLPVLPTPMGKGVVSDDDPHLISPARSFALQNADVILLIGARLNWILHFGLPPRFRKGVRVLQIDLNAEEIGTNVPTEVGMVGDARAVTAQLNQALDAEPFTLSADNGWLGQLRESASQNQAAVQAMLEDDSEPMGYYRALREIADRLEPQDMLVAEGANTMDISRTVLPNMEPRKRLDAGTFGTMGVGTGLAIAAAVVHPDRRTICVQGDSAFGFSGMEVEVACRYDMPITFVVINNNGIGGGVSEYIPGKPLPTSTYTLGARYERVIEAFGGVGYYVEKVADLGPTLDKALASNRPALVNVLIDPKAQRKPQKFAWLTR